jgi:hypothetical protein
MPQASLESFASPAADSVTPSQANQMILQEICAKTATIVY